MEVDRINFPSKLIDILESLADSHFVSFDLELSGVPVRPFGAPSVTSAHYNGRAIPTLQQRYLETKAAAEKYTVLQFGFTCVKEDRTANGGTVYTCRPYNVNLSPVIEERIEIDRDVAFHSGAVEFLLSVDFDFHAPFRSGVPYLSRDDAKLAMQRAHDRDDREKNQADIEVGADNVDAHKLMDKARSIITAWLAKDPDPSDQLHLGPRKIFEGTSRAADQDMLRYEKRLIHQLVRKDFPELGTVSKRGVIIVLFPDEQRELKIKQQRLQEAQARVNRQSGFRWVVEAMAGRQLSGIDPKWFTQDPQTGDTRYMDMTELNTRFLRARDILRQRPRVIVGHNVYGDLVYMYATLIGQLPDTVERFQAEIHKLFPLVIDTKYLATQGSVHSNTPSSLEQLIDLSKDQHHPIIQDHPEHDKYNEVEAAHEAGYDSLITAKLAIKLSAKLDAEQKGVDTQDLVIEDETEENADDQIATPEGGGVSLVVESIKGLVVNPFYALSAHAEEKREEWEDDQKVAASSYQQVVTGMSEWNEGEPEWKPLRRMPRFESDFWSTYGNRLRVFGTQEGICPLTPVSTGTGDVEGDTAGGSQD